MSSVRTYKPGDLTRNSVMCLKCGDEISSVHVHDFKSCSCGNVAVDGGLHYTRRVFITDEWEDTSTYEEPTVVSES